MSSLATRLPSSVWGWGGLAVATLSVYYLYSISLVRTNVISGCVLFILLLILVLYNLRKKIPSIPLGTSAVWLRFHIYAGLFSMLIFVLHLDFRYPYGALETSLAVLYLAVAGSGVVGLVLSRVLPKRLVTRGVEVIFERIPSFQRSIREEAEGLVEETGSAELGNYYMTHLSPFFAKTQHAVSHLMESDRPRQTLLDNLRAMDRYWGTKERESAKRLEDLINRKDDLDYHETLQGILKSWLFVHIPLSAGLLIFSMIHGVLAYMYSPRII